MKRLFNHGVDKKHLGGLILSQEKEAHTEGGRVCAAARVQVMDQRC